MGADDAVERGDVVAVAVGRGRADAPQLGGHEHVALDEALRRAARCRARLTSPSAIRWRLRSPNSGTRIWPLSLRGSVFAQSSSAEVVDGGLRDLAGRAACRRCRSGAGIGEGEAVERQRRAVARGAAESVEDLARRCAAASLPGRIVGHHARRRPAGSPGRRPAPRRRRATARRDGRRRRNRRSPVQRVPKRSLASMP